MNTAFWIKRLQHRAVLALGVVLLSLPLLGASCLGQDLAPPAPQRIVIWRSEDAAQDFAAAIAAYSGQYPQVSFEYRTFKSDEYEQALLDAWARGEGPDIFSVPNNNLGKYRQFIAPMPQSVTLRRAFSKRSFGRNVTVVEDVTTRLTAPSQLRDTFAGAVANDVTFDNQIYGLPLSVDTLVLYVNRDLLAKAQIAVTPTTWEDFRNAVQAMTILDQDKKIVQSAVALGTAENVPYFFDLLSVIMMQNGTEMATQEGVPAFAAETAGRRLPGAESVDFYTKFADDRFKTYTWNSERPNGFEAFTQGSSGMVFGYQSDRKVIEQRAPNLNFTIAPLPQIDTGNPVNLAHYSVETVHVQSNAKEHAWNFIHSMATNPENATAFSASTGRPPALLSLIGPLQQDPELGVFARQALTARSWYHGTDLRVALNAFEEMITQVVARTATIQDSINLAAQKISLTVQPRQ